MDIEEINRLSSDSKNLKLLYIEDDESAREAMLEILDLFFNDISVAVDGQDGFEKFKSNKIDIIITDISMPKMNGLDMISAIREVDEDIPVIILSAHDESKFFIQSINLGISAFIFKPVELDNLIIVLRKIIKKMLLLSKAKENLQLLSEYQEAINEASIVSKTDLRGVITYANDEFCKVSEYTKNELIGESHNIIRHPDVSPLIFEDLWSTIRDKKQIWQGVIKNSAKSGKVYYVDSTVKPILNHDGEIVEYIAIRNNITKLVNLNDEINKLHAYDIEQQHIAREKVEVGIRNDMSIDEARVIYTPLDILSGDFYSIYKRKDGSTFMYIIDGQGHGISPALTIFSISSVINNVIDSIASLEELTSHIFPIIQTFLGDIEQLSYIMVMINEDAKTISYASGGMYPFLIKTVDEVKKIKTNNTPFMNFSPNPTVDNINLGQWDSLLLFSDGFVEHENDTLDGFTPLDIINEPSLIQSAIDTLKSSQLEDDVTLIHLRNINE